MHALEVPTHAPKELNVSASAGQRWMLLVFLALACIPLYWSVHSVIVRLGQKYPQSPWESEIATDAWRANHGLPVYTLPAQDHATHFYGPLVTYLTAAIFRISKFNIAVPRWIAFVSAATLSIGVSIIAARRRGWLIFFIGIAMIFMQFYRARANFAESRPDAASALFTAIAVWMFYLAHTRNFWWMAAGVAAMLIGFFFKQTASAAAFVPVIAVLLTRPNKMFKHLALAVVPILAMGATFGILRVFAPVMYWYLIVVPTLFHIYVEDWPLKFIQVITMNTLFCVAVVVWALDRHSSKIGRQESLWLLTSVMVTWLSSCTAISKWGAKENSYLPVFLAMAVFSLAMLPRILGLFSEICAGQKSGLLLAAVLGVLFIADATSVPNYAYWAAKGAESDGDSSYYRIIDRVRHLNGRIICPDDPTIPLLAKGTLNRDVICELDVVAYAYIAPYVLDEWSKADYLIRPRVTVLGSQVALSELSKLGYKQVPDRVFAKTGYSLWRRNAHKESHAPA